MAQKQPRRRAVRRPAKWAERFPNDDGIVEARRERRRRSLPPGAQCTQCGDSDPDVLLPSSEPLVCMDCNAETLDRSVVEEHHVAGRANSDFTLPLTRNDHAAVTRLQDAWPERTLTNPDDSLLRAAAASVRGWLDMLRLIIDRGIGWVPACLEALDEWLYQAIGPDWVSRFRSYVDGGDDQSGLEGAK